MMPKLRKVAKTPVLERFSVGKDSHKADTSDTQQNPDEQQNHKKYPASLRFLFNNPPMTGAATGATPLIAPITASILASSLSRNLSVATEREITIPPPLLHLVSAVK